MKMLHIKIRRVYNRYKFSLPKSINAMKHRGLQIRVLYFPAKILAFTWGLTITYVTLNFTLIELWENVNESISLQIMVRFLPHTLPTIRKGFSAWLYSRMLLEIPYFMFVAR